MGSHARTSQSTQAYCSCPWGQTAHHNTPSSKMTSDGMVGMDGDGMQAPRTTDCRQSICMDLHACTHHDL